MALVRHLVEPDSRLDTARLPLFRDVPFRHLALAPTTVPE